jgi:transposase
MSETHAETKLVKKRELAAMIGVSARTVANWVDMML